MNPAEKGTMRVSRFEPTNGYIRDGVRRSFRHTFHHVRGSVEFDFVVAPVDGPAQEDALPMRSTLDPTNMPPLPQVAAVIVDSEHGNMAWISGWAYEAGDSIIDQNGQPTGWTVQAIVAPGDVRMEHSGGGQGSSAIYGPDRW